MQAGTTPATAVDTRCSDGWTTATPPSAGDARRGDPDRRTPSAFRRVRSSGHDQGGVVAWFLTLSHGRDKVRVMGTMVAQGGVVPVRMSVPPPVAGDAAGREDAAPFGRGGVEVGGGHGAGGIDDGCDGDAGSAQGGAVMPGMRRRGGRRSAGSALSQSGRTTPRAHHFRRSNDVFRMRAWQ